MTDISFLVMSSAQSVLVLALSITAGRAGPTLKALMIAGNLTVLVFIGAIFFGGMKIEVPLNTPVIAIWYGVVFALFVVAIKVMIDPRGPWSRRES